MPFVSKAQRERLLALVKDGKMSQSKFDEFDAGTPKDLPERVSKKKTETKPAAKKKARRYPF